MRKILYILFFTMLAVSSLRANPVSSSETFECSAESVNKSKRITEDDVVGRHALKLSDGGWDVSYKPMTLKSYLGAGKWTSLPNVRRLSKEDVGGSRLLLGGLRLTSQYGDYPAVEATIYEELLDGMKVYSLFIKVKDNENHICYVWGGGAPEKQMFLREIYQHH
jgi:hypothetical protein